MTIEATVTQIANRLKNAITSTASVDGSISPTLSQQQVSCPRPLPEADTSRNRLTRRYPRVWYNNTVDLLTKLTSQARAVWSLFASLFKSEWAIEDYPVRTSLHPVSESSKASRLKSLPWAADVINWPVMSGHGNTKKEARETLRKNFDHFKANRKELPRPGTKVP